MHYLWRVENRKESGDDKQSEGLQVKDLLSIRECEHLSYKNCAMNCGNPDTRSGSADSAAFATSTSFAYFATVTQRMSG